MSRNFCSFFSIFATVVYATPKSLPTLSTLSCAEMFSKNQFFSSSRNRNVSRAFIFAVELIIDFSQTLILEKL